MRVIQIASCLVILASTVASAQKPAAKGAKTATAAAAKAPAAPAPPPPEVKRTVDAFVGKWTFQTTMTMPGGKPTTFPETIDCTRAALGRAVSCTDTATMPGMGPVEYNYLGAYDAETKVVHFYAVGSPGEVHDHRCNWKTEKLLECEPLKATLDGAPLTETIAFTIVDANTMTLKGTTTTKDGAIAIEATGKRAASK